MSVEKIQNDIGSIVGSQYSLWTIGITADPVHRKQKHANPLSWQQWETTSETAARQIKKHFLAKGCQGTTEVSQNPDHVYIF